METLGKFSAIVVFVSFAAFVSFFLIGGDLFLGDLRVDAKTITGHPLPPDFDVEQSLKTDDGLILVGIDRTVRVRIHFVRARSTPDELDSTEKLLRKAKVYRTSGVKNPDFLTKYLSAHVDPRRTEVKEGVAVFSNDEKVGSLLRVTAQSGKWFSVLYLPTERILFLANNPDEQVTEKQTLDSLKNLGYLLSISP